MGLSDDDQPGVSDKLLVAASLVVVGAAVVLGLLVFTDPAVTRLRWPWVATFVGAVAILGVVAMRDGSRSVVREWAGPIAALSLALVYLGPILTWSTGWWFLLMFLGFPLALIIHGAIMVRSWMYRHRQPLVSAAGALLIGATWFVGLSVGRSELPRQTRVELAAPDLTREARLLLDKSSGSGPSRGAAFVAVSSDGQVVGWVLGTGLLGNGTGLIWDPDGILMPDGAASTTQGYPWYIQGRDCELIMGPWLYCQMD